MNLKTQIAIASFVLGSLTACAAPDDDDASSAEPAPASAETSTADQPEIGVSMAALTLSFRSSCKNIYYELSGGAVTFADAYCRRRNGSWIWTNYQGRCTSDLANCDGHLRCGGC